MIAQNAIRIKLKNEILISKHVHDYVESKDGNIAIDGGNEYCRRIGCTGDKVEELSFGVDSPIEVKADRILWGSYGKSGKEPLQYVLLKECSTSHLKNIIKNCKISEELKNIINYILENRQKLFLTKHGT